jgi:hypothetical protein
MGSLYCETKASQEFSCIPAQRLVLQIINMILLLLVISFFHISVNSCYSKKLWCRKKNVMGWRANLKVLLEALISGVMKSE